MPQTTTEFFEQLAERGHEPLLEKVTGTLRFDLKDNGRLRAGWSRSRRATSPSRARTPRRTASSAPTRHSSTRSSAAKTNPFAAMLRGAVGIEGDSELIVLFQRVFRSGAAMSDDLVQILDGNTFVVSDARGDIEASPTEPTGLFSFDTRFLSRWVLTVDGQRLNPLSVDDLQYFESRFFLVPGTGTVYIDAKLSVIRQRAVGDGFHEELTILNHDDEPVDLTVRIEAASDFADLFEVKDALKKKGSYSTTDRGRAAACSATSARRSGARPRSPRRHRRSVDEHGLTFTVRDRAARQLDDRPRRRHRPPARAARTPGRSTSAAGSRPGRTWSGASSAGSRTRPGSSATGSR